MADMEVVKYFLVANTMDTIIDVEDRAKVREGSIVLISRRKGIPP